MSPITYKHAVGGALVRRTASNPRSSLVPGTYKPDNTNTGHVGVSLPKQGTTSTTTVVFGTAGAVYENLEIYGDIRITAADITIRNCYLRGGSHKPGGASAVIDCNSAAVFNLLVEDCTIDPHVPSVNRDGMVGHEYTARRVRVKNTIDGFGVFQTDKVAAVTGINDANVTVEGCYTSDLAYFYPDYKVGSSGATWHTDGTHNDGLQIQGGGNIHVIGNYFEMSGHKGPGSLDSPTKPWMHTIGHANGSGTIIQGNADATPLGPNVVVEKNWYWGGLCHLQLQPGTYAVKNNKHSRVTAKRPAGAAGEAWSGTWIIATSTAYATDTIVDGIFTGTPSSVWEDDGTLLVQPAASGIRIGWA